MRVEQTNSVMPHIDLGLTSNRSCPLAWFVLVSLPALLFGLVLMGYLGMISFPVHLHSVVMIGVIFFIYLIFVKHNAYYAGCTFSNAIDDLEESLAHYIHNNRLQLAKKTKSNAPFDTFMQEYTQTLRNDNFASVASTIFPTLGILGTFISIALTMPSFAMSQNGALEREIAQLLSGVGTAFYVSIYGIFLSIWWIFFEKGGMSRFEKLISRIKERTRHYFWTKEEIEQIHFVKSIENFEHLNQIFEKITANEFIDNLQHILQQRVDLFESVLHHEQEILQKSTKHFNQIMRTTQATTQKSTEMMGAYEQIADSLSNMTHQVDLSTQLLKDISHKLTTKESNLDLAYQKIQESLKKLEADSERLIRRAQEPKIIDNR